MKLESLKDLGPKKTKKVKKDMGKLKVIRAIVKHRREPFTLIKPLSKAVRCFCLECVGYSSNEVDKCTDVQCHLFPYRLGKHAEEIAKTG